MSVGVDANLCINDTITRTLTKYPPIPHGSNVVLARTAPPTKRGSTKVALRYENKIEVWNLGEAINITSNMDTSSNNPSWMNTYLPLKEDAEKLITLTTKDNMPILTFDMSADASVLAYVTTDCSVRMFQIDYETDKENQISLPKISRIPFKKQTGAVGDYDEAMQTKLLLSPFNIVKFLPAQDKHSNLQVLLSTIGGTLQCYEIPNRDESVEQVATFLWSLCPTNLDLHSGICHLEVHPKGIACAIADFDGNVRLINLRSINDSIKLINLRTMKSDDRSQDIEGLNSSVRKIPHYNMAVVSCMSFNPGTEGNLVIVYANHHFVEVDSTNGKYTEFTNKITNTGKKFRQIPLEWTEKKFATRGIAFLEGVNNIGNRSEDVIMFYDEANICTFNKHTWLANLMEGKPTNKGKIPQSESPVAKSAKRNKGNYRLVIVVWASLTRKKNPP